MSPNKYLAYLTGGIAVLYGASYLARQSSLAKKTDFKVISVKKSGITLQGITLELNAKLTNETDIDFDVTKQLYYIYLNNYYVGVVTSTDRLKVPKKGSSDVKLLIFIDFANALKAGLNANLKNIGANILKIDGKLSTRTFGVVMSGIPIKLEFKLSEFLS